MDAAFHIPSGVDGCCVRNKGGQGGLCLVNGVYVEIAVHNVSVELDGAPFLDFKVAGCNAQGHEFVVSAAYVIVSVYVESRGTAVEFHHSAAPCRKNVSAGLVDFYIGRYSRGGVYPEVDCKIGGPGLYVLDFLHHLLVWIHYHRYFYTLESEEVVVAGSAGVGNRDMQVTCLLRGCVYIQNECREWSAYAC